MKTITKSEYDVQAEKFVKQTGIEIVKTYTGHRCYFDGDKDRRSTWCITVKRADSSFSYDFGQSVMESFLVIDPAGSQHFHRPMTQEQLRYTFVAESIRAKSGHMDRRVKECQTPPTDYSLLACMASDSYHADTFDDWCGNFGYDTDSRKALDTFLKCQKISSDIQRFFTNAEIEQLQEIN